MMWSQLPIAHQFSSMFWLFTLLTILSLALAHFKSPSTINGAVYEISTRPWLYELSQKYQRSIHSLDDVPDAEIQVIANMNMDMVYMMGVWQLGPSGLLHDRTDPGLINGFKRLLPDFTMDDVIGSPYAVVNYSTNSVIGGNGALTRFRYRLRKFGLRLMLDFVPNHMATDTIFMSNLRYFIRCPPGWDCPSSEYLRNGVAYGKDPYSGAWTDTAQLNYWDQETIKLQIQNLLTVASYADGIRVDMAMLLLNDVIEMTWGNHMKDLGYSKPRVEFWESAIKEVKKQFPDCLFLAEQYWYKEEELLGLGFDSVYDKDGMYEALKSGDLDNIRGLVWGRKSHMIHFAHFVENHDEERAVVSFGSATRSIGAALVSFTLPGLKFHHHGQWEGKRNRLDVHLRRSASEAVDKAVSQWYNNYLTSDLSIFKTGKFSPVAVQGTSDCWRLLSWKWTLDSDLVLVVVNYSDNSGSGKISLDIAGETIRFYDVLTGNYWDWSGKDVRSGEFIAVIEAWNAQIFKVYSV
ncbi:hypothetical protein GEMRC1_011850 [Eukaryota sp. GEM-RC1]